MDRRIHEAIRRRVASNADAASKGCLGLGASGVGVDGSTSSLGAPDQRLGNPDGISSTHGTLCACCGEFDPQRTRLDCALVLLLTDGAADRWRDVDSWHGIGFDQLSGRRRYSRFGD